MLSLDMAYRLYGAISVNANFQSCAPYSAACLRTGAVHDRDNDGLLPSGSHKNETVRGGARHSARIHRAAYLYSVGPKGPEP
jgi:hypothetical protein